MALGRWLICGLIGVGIIGLSGCSSNRGCCHKRPLLGGSDCCPPPGPVFPAGPVAPAAPATPPTQAFSVGPTCAIPLQ